MNAAAEHVGRAGAARSNAWTPARIEERLRKAVALQTDVSSGADELDANGTTGPAGMTAMGTAGVIGEPIVRDASEALSWLRWLEPNDAGILLARLEGAPWKAICFRFGVSRPTADRRWRYALGLIAWRLNGHATSKPPPSLRSMLDGRVARSARQV